MAMARVVLRGIAWLLGIAVLALAVLFGINATDEALSEQAQAALRTPPPPPASERNGFIDFLVLGAPADAPTFATGLKELGRWHSKEQGEHASSVVVLDPRLPRCRRGEFLSCVAAAPGQPPLKELIDSHAVFLKRYRAMREKPEFVELFVAGSPEDPLPAYIGLASGQRLSLMRAAIDFNSGAGASAIGELEAEFAFYRKVAVTSRTLLPKYMAFAMLDGAALFAAELARKTSPREKVLSTRLGKLLRAPTKAELDFTAAWDQELARTAAWMRTRRYVRLSDELYASLKAQGQARTQPWWDPVAPWLYRPHYGVNLHVARVRSLQAIAELPSKDFLGALGEHRARAEALAPAGWKRLVLSPVGHNHFYFDHDPSDEVGRMHGHTALQALVALQARLRAAGIAKPADVLAALDGPLGAAYPDPFTGRPFRFNPQRMTLGFVCELNYLTGVARDLRAANGRVELPL
jgi:hypothetical protein